MYAAHGTTSGEQPGDGDNGAARDRTDEPRLESNSSSTNIESLSPQNSVVDLSQELKWAARLHIGAGQLVLDSTFSFANEYVDLTQARCQAVPLTATGVGDRSLGFGAVGDISASTCTVRLWERNRRGPTTNNYSGVINYSARNAAQAYKMTTLTSVEYIVIGPTEQL